MLEQSRGVFEIMWDAIRQRKYAEVNNSRDITLEGFSIKPKPEVKTSANIQNHFRIPTRG